GPASTTTPGSPAHPPHFSSGHSPCDEQATDTPASPYRPCRITRPGRERMTAGSARSPCRDARPAPGANVARMARRRSTRSQRSADHAGVHRIDSGEAEIVVDRDDPEGRFVYVNGVPSSYVHLGDPTILSFEYVRWIGDLLDVFAPAGERLRVAHLGGAGCTL